jgi:hypothetical protein
MSSPSPIWYLLFNSETGKQCIGSSASYILRTSLVIASNYPPDVDDFRNAVKAENSNRLSCVPSGALLVYKNKDAFDKRNLSVDEGKEEPLEVDSLMDGLGSEDDMLIVVGPPWDGSFLQCNIPFFQSIFNVTEINGWISFGQHIPCTSLKALYIRKCYKKIASSINPGINKTIITGTMGIGKSIFLIYLLWKLVQEGKRVLLIYPEFNIYYDGKGGVFTVESLPSGIDERFWNETLWCLFDSKQKKYSNLGEVSYFGCTFILSMSPQQELINDFKKPPVPQYFYMPTWTEAELEMIASLFCSTNPWRDRFKILGGIPQHVLKDTKYDPTTLLEVACTDCTLDDCIEEVNMSITNTNKSNAIHCLIHIHSEDPYTESSVCYASETALEIIVQKKRIEAKRKFRSLLAAPEWNPLPAALCEYIFESHAIDVLQKGGKFTCRQLVHGNTNNKPKNTELVIPPSTKIFADQVVFNQVHNQLYVPTRKNYPGIDAWIPGVGAFQMTVGKKHSINSGIRKQLDMLGKGNKLYWLLPPVYFTNFARQAPKEIEQYALLIPIPDWHYIL